MTYVAINITDQIDHWFDSYLIDNGGQVSWAQFCADIFLRYAQDQPLDVIIKFNRIQQVTDITSYQRHFEELRGPILLAMPHLDEAYFITYFIGGLTAYLGPMVKMANPQTLLTAML